jgi:hypothetical protein
LNYVRHAKAPKASRFITPNNRTGSYISDILCNKNSGSSVNAINMWNRCAFSAGRRVLVRQSQLYSKKQPFRSPEGSAVSTKRKRGPGSRPRAAIQALNFFVADAQAGIGPFLGVFLQARGWTTGAIGTVMTIGGIAGMIVTAPAGALVDATTHKRRYIIVSAICTIMASALIWVSQGFWVIA